MRFFAIGDLHLPGGAEGKTMDIFGEAWENHFDKIRADWLAKVGDDDVVLIPGDISWAMAFDDAREDISLVCGLPGRKVLLKGNHDYWWGSVARLRDVLTNRTFALQNDAIRFCAEDGSCAAVAGSRGWEHPLVESKVQKRELIRLELSLSAAEKLGCGRIIAMTHYPPFGEKGEDTAFTRLIEAYGVSDVVFGHLHGNISGAVTREMNGVRYHLVSCDNLGFSLFELS